MTTPLPPNGTVLEPDQFTDEEQLAEAKPKKDRGDVGGQIKVF